MVFSQGPGMWGGGYGLGYGVPFWGNNNTYGTYPGQGTLTKQDAEAIVGKYIGGNPNLKSGKIEDKTIYFETEIRTMDNFLVSKLAIDKNTG